MLQELDLPEEVRSFLEAVLESYPAQDLYLLSWPKHEPSEEGHALTKAMRDLL